MTLRLRCVRCGDWDEMEPDQMYGWALCSSCWRKASEVLDSGIDEKRVRAFHRLMDRWQRNVESHPTYRALTAALDALEAVPHGSLAEVNDV